MREKPAAGALGSANLPSKDRGEGSLRQVFKGATMIDATETLRPVIRLLRPLCYGASLGLRARSSCLLRMGSARGRTASPVGGEESGA